MEQSLEVVFHLLSQVPQEKLLTLKHKLRALRHMPSSRVLQAMVMLTLGQESDARICLDALGDHWAAQYVQRTKLDPAGGQESREDLQPAQPDPGAKVLLAQIYSLLAEEKLCSRDAATTDHQAATRAHQGHQAATTDQTAATTDHQAATTDQTAATTDQTAATTDQTAATTDQTAATTAHQAATRACDASTEIQGHTHHSIPPKEQETQVSAISSDAGDTFLPLRSDVDVGLQEGSSPGYVLRSSPVPIGANSALPCPRPLCSLGSPSVSSLLEISASPTVVFDTHLPSGCRPRPSAGSSSGARQPDRGRATHVPQEASWVSRDASWQLRQDWDALQVSCPAPETQVPTLGAQNQPVESSDVSSTVPAEPHPPEHTGSRREEQGLPGSGAAVGAAPAHMPMEKSSPPPGISSPDDSASSLALSLPPPTYPFSSTLPPLQGVPPNSSYPPPHLSSHSPAWPAPLKPAEPVPTSAPPLKPAEPVPTSAPPLKPAEPVPTSAPPLKPAEPVPTSAPPLKPAEPVPTSEPDGAERKFFTFVVLHAGQDEAVAHRVKNLLENMGVPNGATLCEDFSIAGRSHMTCFQDAMENSAFIILLLTNNFFCNLCMFQTDTALMESIQNPAKRHSVIPFVPRENPLREIPSTLSGLVSLDETSPLFSKRVQKTFSSNSIMAKKVMWDQRRKLQRARGQSLPDFSALTLGSHPQEPPPATWQQLPQPQWCPRPTNIHPATYPPSLPAQVGPPPCPQGHCNPSPGGIIIQQARMIQIGNHNTMQVETTTAPGQEGTRNNEHGHTHP